MIWESFYILNRNSNFPIIKTYTQYCIILRTVIRRGKQIHYDNLLVSAKKIKNHVEYYKE